MPLVSSNLKQRWQKWIKKRHPKHNPQQLSTNQIYILPSIFGLGFAVVLLSIGIGAINYQVNPAFFFVFLLMIIGFSSMWESHRNLKGLTIQCLPIDDTEEGKPVKIALHIKGSGIPRYALWFSFKQGDVVKLEQLPVEGKQVLLPLPTDHRGAFEIPPIKIESFYPLGLFHVWSYAYFNVSYYVYPEAISPDFWPEVRHGEAQKLYKHLAGDEELYELKNIENPWVQPSRIAWKISSRKQGWYLKNMSNPAGESWVFRIDDLPHQDIESNLRHLSYWIQSAEQKGHAYGLDQKGTQIEISHGENHMRYCLRQLATYPE